MPDNSMDEKKSFFGLSGSALKILAIITMLIDHIGAFVVYPYLAGNNVSNYEEVFNLYYIMRIMGRVAFPIFVFLLVEGIKHTKDIRKYILRMFIFAMISEVPFVLAAEKEIKGITMTNVFFTLTTGLIICAIIEKLLDYKKLSHVVICALSVFIGGVFVRVMDTDYGIYGVFAVLAGYIISRFTNNIKERYSYIATISGICLVLICIGGLEIFAVLSILPICFYNGSRGIKLKYVFYGFYPVHLLVLTLVRIAMS